MRIFLGPHRPGFALVRIEQAGFLHDRAPVFDHINLTARLNLNRLHHEADAVHILRLGPRAEGIAGLSHADIDVGAHRSFLHIAIA